MKQIPLLRGTFPWDENFYILWHLIFLKLNLKLRGPNKNSLLNINKVSSNYETSEYTVFLFSVLYWKAIKATLWSPIA